MAQGRDDPHEARFVDAVSGRLAVSDFNLIVAGDGIRSDMHTIPAFLGSAGGLIARFALVEFQVWHDSAGTTVVLPMVPCRTEVIEHRVFIGPGGQPVTVEAAIEQRDELPDHDSDRERRDAINRAFWDRLIATIQFSHPDPAPPRHGGPKLGPRADARPTAAHDALPNGRQGRRIRDFHRRCSGRGSRALRKRPRRTRK